MFNNRSGIYIGTGHTISEEEIQSFMEEVISLQAQWQEESAKTNRISFEIYEKFIDCRKSLKQMITLEKMKQKIATAHKELLEAEGL